MRPFSWVLLVGAVLFAACGAPTPLPSRTFPQAPEETSSSQPSLELPSTEQPSLTVNPGLHIDGMATVVRAVDQIADPEHPNHQKDNRKFQRLEAGTRVYLVNKVTRRKTNYWQVYDGFSQYGGVGWIPQLSNEESNLEAYQPDCPTDFPLTAESFDGFTNGDGAPLTCFGNTELTLSGSVTCYSTNIDYTVGGASYLDSSRSCYLGSEDGLHLYGADVYHLLDAQPEPTVTGNYLVRGHFDDAEAQACHVIPFGTGIGADPGATGDAGSVMACRQLFVVSTVVSRE